MRYDSIADIYSANEKFRNELTTVLADVSPEEAAATPSGEKWSIQQIAEHVSMVDEGISRICAKLLAASKAAGKGSAGGFALSEKFKDGAARIADMKLEAPDRVQPSGTVPIEESIDKLQASSITFDALRSDFEAFDSSEPTFPHPYLGDMTAGEWLVLAGHHQNRHMKQIEALLGRIRQEKIPG